MKKLSPTISICFLVLLVQPVFGASIISWGKIVFDGRELDANDFVTASAGAYHSLTLKSNGSIVGWGYNVGGGDFVFSAADVSGRGFYHHLATDLSNCLLR